MANPQKLLGLISFISGVWTLWSYGFGFLMTLNRPILRVNIDSAEMSPVEEILNWEPTQLESPTEIINIASPLNLGEGDEGKRKWDYERQSNHQGSSMKREEQSPVEGLFYDEAEGVFFDNKVSQFNSIQERYNVSILFTNEISNDFNSKL